VGDFSGVAQSERRFFTHDENFKECMMGGGGGITFIWMWGYIIRRSSLQVMNAIQEALAPVGQT
jgi:hypothetical protein